MSEYCRACNGTTDAHHRFCPLAYANEQSSLAATACYASWVIVINAKREPIVKRCSSRESEIAMMKAMRKMNPNATVIHAKLNPGDHNELWATSERHFLTVAEA